MGLGVFEVFEGGAVVGAKVIVVKMIRLLSVEVKLSHVFILEVDNTTLHWVFAIFIIPIRLIIKRNLIMSLYFIGTTLLLVIGHKLFPPGVIIIFLTELPLQSLYLPPCPFPHIYITTPISR